MGFKIAIDTGGTFSDVVVTGDNGHLSLHKASTTPERIFDGIGQALTLAGEGLGLTLEQLLGQTDALIYGTTRSLNAIVTGSTAVTALITTKGFGDTLVFREGGKQRPFDFRYPYPEPYIPKRLTFEVDERISAEGQVVKALDRNEVAKLLGKLSARNVEAVAVSLLWSIENPGHELMIGEMIESELPGVPFTLSHKLNPIIREYRRTSSAAIDASLKPLMQEHLSDMERDLRDAGFNGELLLMTSFGGVMRLADVAERPLYSVNSGPAMAPIAGRIAAAPAEDIVVCDTGGTSFDVSVVRAGEIMSTRETWLGEPFTGHITGLSSVAVKNVGAGGGSIAWIDPGGLLRVGPQSAGAEPGPVCYSRGGTEPTVTDAAVTLGYIDPSYFLAGKLALDANAAREAIRTLIAGPLGLSVHQAAWAILAVANEHMVTAVRSITIDQGIDPRDCVIVAGGGAGGLTMAKIAEALGCRQVLVPRTASALSATGGLFGDIVAEFTVSRRVDTGDFDFDSVNSALESLDKQLDGFFERMAIAPKARRKDYVVEAHYPYQVWELDVPLAKGRFDGPADVEALVDGFHDLHERVYAVKEPGQRVECLYWKGRATVKLPKPSLRFAATNRSGSSAPDRHRMTWWGSAGSEKAPIFRAESLSVHGKIAGPAIIELPTTTVVVYPEWRLEVTERGDFLLSRD
jgi:N-methylhydantoinase A